MKHFLDRFDGKYIKIATYAGIAVLVTFFTGLLIWNLLPGLKTLTALLGAVLRPLIIGGVLCYLVYPLVNKTDAWFQKRFPGKKWTRTVSVFLILILVLLIIVIFLVVVSSTLVSQINFQSIIDLFENTKTDFDTLIKQVEEYLKRFNIDIPNIGSSVSNITGFVGSIASGASTLFFGIIFGIYFLIDGENIGGYWRKVVYKVFKPKTIAVAKELLKDADSCFSGYIRGQSMDAILVGAVVSIVFSLMGMKYALVIGLLTGVGNLIPYVGPILGYGSVIIVNLLNWNPTMLIWGLIVLQVIMTIDGNIINPRLLAGTIEIHPLLVVASLLAGGAIGGLLGMLLAVPVGAFLRLQFEKWLAKKQPPTDDEPSEKPSDTEQAA